MDGRAGLYFIDFQDQFLCELKYVRTIHLSLFFGFTDYKAIFFFISNLCQLMYTIMYVAYIANHNLTLSIVATR